MYWTNFFLKKNGLWIFASSILQLQMTQYIERNANENKDILSYW